MRKPTCSGCMWWSRYGRMAPNEGRCSMASATVGDGEDEQGQMLVRLSRPALLLTRDTFACQGFVAKGAAA